MKVFSRGVYRFYYCLVVFLIHWAHPIVKVRGRENIPEGAALLCGNHSAFSDPIWVVAAARLKKPLRIMSKKELLETPVLGRFLQGMGAFPVERGTSDIKSIYTALRALREKDKVLVFPEGTRIRNGKVSTPHNGAMLLSTRTNTPIVPLYLSEKKHFWSVIRVNFGKPIYPQPDEKLTNEELTERSAELMRVIYALKEQK